MGDGAAKVIDGIDNLPEDWHGAGSVPKNVLEAIAEHTRGVPVECSVETGTGKTTLLLSHLSSRHLVFTKDDRNDGDSLDRVRESPLLVSEVVDFVLGPTQLTLPGYRFDRSLDLALIDGPHAYPFPEIEYYCLYPHLRPGALLIVDDIQIPTIRRLFDFLREDEMFDVLETVGTTAFLRRTEAATFDPLSDGWWLQNFNKRRHPVYPTFAAKLQARVLSPIRTMGGRALRLTGRSRVQE